MAEKPAVADEGSFRNLAETRRQVIRMIKNPYERQPDDPESVEREDFICGIIVTTVKAATGPNGDGSFDAGCGRMKLVKITCDGHCDLTSRVEVVWNEKEQIIPADITKLYCAKRHYETGMWIVEPDQEDIAASDATSTTSTTTTPHLLACDGLCKYLANSSLQWELVSDPIPCVPTTSSSTSSTTSSSTTTGSPTSPTSTTPDCNRCSSTTSSSSTSSTTSIAPTTTTVGPCHCSFPTFCPTFEGQCTYTYCTSGFTSNAFNVPCSTSTTTNTSSTTTPTCPEDLVCSGSGCHWVGHYLGWTKVDDDCVNCLCSIPVAAPDPCATAFTSCVYPVPTTTVPCSGTCTFMLIPGVGYISLNSTCENRTRLPCLCPLPPLPPPGTLNCGVATTNCEEGTTTTPHPCSPTTSVPPTTTGSPCGGPCRWIQNLSDATDWTRLSGSCTGGCLCTKPDHQPYDSCEIALTPCISYPTTTTTTTSTTTTSSTTTNGECTGTCLFTYNSGWNLTSNTCINYGTACQCCEPSDVGSEDEERITACNPGATNEAACSTTPSCELTACQWQCERYFNGGDPFDDGNYTYFWQIQSPDCVTPCVCTEPLGTCQNSNLFEFRNSTCTPGTTTAAPTTTTSTTTTPAPGSWYCANPIDCDPVTGSGNFGCFLEPSSFHCAGPYATMEECEAAGCPTTTPGPDGKCCCYDDFNALQDCFDITEAECIALAVDLTYATTVWNGADTCLDGCDDPYTPP